MTDNNNSDLDLRRFLRSVSRLKWVYLASFLLFMGLAVTYCIIKQPQYEVKATILIEDNTDDAPSGAGGMAAMMKTFSVGGFGASSVDNELLLINSHDVLMRTAKALQLNRNYIERDGLSKRMLFNDSPIRVDGQEEMFDTLSRAMKMRVEIKGKKADIKVTRGLMGQVLAELTDVELPVNVEVPAGQLRVVPTDAWTGRRQTIDVSIGSYPGAADFLETDIMVDKPDKLADAISFEMLYPNRERGMAILNVLMAEYNNKRLNRKHETANTELEFLDGRIAAIFGELTDAEDKIKEFKDKHNIVGIGMEAPLLAESSLTTKGEMVKAQAETMYLKEVLASLRDPKKADDLLPVFDSEAYPMVKDYNQLVIEKRQLEQSAKPGNPVLVETNANLSQMRTSVINNIQSMLEASQALLKTQSSLAGTADSRLSKLPAIERNYIDLERDRQLKNSLYIYLVDKRESALLQIYSQNTLGFVVDDAYCAIKPSKKKAIIVTVACLFLAFFCPTCLALWFTYRQRRVLSPIDVASYGLEQHAIMLDGTTASTNNLRDMLLQRGVPQTVYIAGNEQEAVGQQLTDSLAAIDLKVAKLSPSEAGLPDDNDSLRRDSFASRLADALADNNVVIVDVPSFDRINELASLCDDTSAALIAIKSGSVKRATIKSIASALQKANTYIAIIS